MSKLLLKRQVVGIVGISAAVVLLYQNCSQQYGVGSAGEDQMSLRYQYAEVDLSQRSEYPPLKMIFVVDNSDTMRVNQVNLSQSFSTLFSGGASSNLTPHATEVMVLNTAQANGSLVSQSFLDTKTPILGGSQISLATNQTYNQFMTQNRSQNLSGLIAGDILGYQALRLASGVAQRVDYLPAPVLGLSQGSATTVLGRATISKAAGEDPSRINSEFNQRISILDPDRNFGLNPSTVNNITYGEFDQVIDRESALCAVARTLKRNEGAVKAGDLVSVAIFSDENEADVAGLQCVDSVERQPKGDLVSATCRRPTNRWNNQITYDVDVPQHMSTSIRRKETYAGTCKVTFRSDLAVNYRTSTVSLSTGINFYDSSTTCYNKKTSVSYYTYSQTCRDSVCKTNYSASPVVALITGDYSTASGNCSAAALKSALPSSAVLNNSQYPFTCAANAVRGDVVGTQTSDCVVNVAANPSRQVVAGDFSVASGKCTAANIKPLLPAGAILNDARYPVACDSNVTSVTNTSSNLAMNISIPNATALGVPANLPSGSACTQAVRDAKFSNVTLASCTMSWTLPSTNLSYEANESCQAKSDAHCASSSGTRVECNPAVLQVPGERWTTPQAVTAAVGLTCNSSCTGTSLCGSAAAGTTLASHLQSAFPRTIANTCEVVGAPVEVPASIAKRTVNRQDNQALSCSSSCAGTEYCGSTDASRTVEQKLSFDHDGVKGIFPPNTVKYRASTCQVSNTRVTEDKVLPPVFASEFNANTICGGDPLVAQVGPYTNPEQVYRTQYVSGGEGAPRADLLTYIKTRSQELLGSVPPVVSVFVRQPEDGTGSGGSVGTVYNQFADMMGGTKNSIRTSDYSAAFSNLGQAVKSRLEKSIVMKQLSDGRKVNRIWRKSAGQSVWSEQVSPEYWTQSGSTIFFSASYPMTGQDVFRIEYY